MSASIFATMLESTLLQMKSIVDCEWEKRRHHESKALSFAHPTSFPDFEYRATGGFVYSAHGHGRRSMYAKAKERLLTPAASQDDLAATGSTATAAASSPTSASDKEK